MYFSKAESTFYWHNLNLHWVYTDLFRSVYRHTKNIHLAKDVVHDAIVKFAVKSSLQRIDEPHAYFQVVVKNTLMDAFRDSAHFVDEADIQSLVDAERAISDQFSPEKIADLKQRMQALQAIIDCLPPKCRQVFWLHRIEGKPQVEIANELNISLNMVEKHMIRALVDIAQAKDYLLRDH
jgi:RNA polymerase sigma factor (sigma-70 family)